MSKLEGFKESINRERKTLPKYQFEYNYFLVLPFLIVLIFGAVVSTLLFLMLSVTSSGFSVCVPFIVWGSISLVVFVLVVVFGIKVNKRLIEDKTFVLEHKFFPIDYEEAKNNLKLDKLIDDDGFVIDEGDVNDIINYEDFDQPFVQEAKNKVVLKFENSKVDILPNYTVKYMKIAIIDKISGDWKIISSFDNNVYNFLCHNRDIVENVEFLDLIANDKKECAKILLKTPAKE